MSEANKLDHWAVDYALDICRSGSRVICDPPVTTTDDDYLLLVDVDLIGTLEKKLSEDGFVFGTGSIRRKSIKLNWDTGRYETVLKELTIPVVLLEEYPELDTDRDKGNVFHSWKKEQLNLVLTCSPDYFENFYKATKLAKFLNLKSKGDRIALFEAVCYDQWPPEEKKSIGLEFHYSLEPGSINHFNNIVVQTQAALDNNF